MKLIASEKTGKYGLTEAATTKLARAVSQITDDDDRERAERFLNDGEWYRRRAEHRDPERWARSWIAEWRAEALALRDG